MYFQRDKPPPQLMQQAVKSTFILLSLNLPSMLHTMILLQAFQESKNYSGLLQTGYPTEELDCYCNVKPRCVLRVAVYLEHCLYAVGAYGVHTLQAVLTALHRKPGNPLITQ